MIHLPIDDFIPRIKEQLKTHQNLVVTAAPGAGKTTRLPPALMSLTSQKIIVLEPRRMAAMAAAQRIASEFNYTLGEEIGYQVRFAHKCKDNTQLIFMTEALLARKLLTDPELAGVEYIILDEFHERSLHVDLALGLIRELQELGSPLKLIVMSATLEAQKISSYLGNCPVISVPGKLFELNVHHQKSTQVLNTQTQFYENLVSYIKTAEKSSSRDILVFLPGVGEINRTFNLLEDWARLQRIELVSLHGSLPLADQQRALKPSPDSRRIVLSTNIAESSVTLDGVDTVIDSGLQRQLRQDYKTGFSRLELVRISLSSAIQRAGRAARQYPGQCYRLWNKNDELTFPKNEAPEITRVDLAESLLYLSAQGVSDFNSFSWYEKPPQHHIKIATENLKLLDALSDDGKITSLGLELLKFPLPLRMSLIVIEGIHLRTPQTAADIAALLQERDIFLKDTYQHYLGDDLESDLHARLAALEDARLKRNLRGISQNSLKNVLQASEQIKGLIRNSSKTEADIDSRQLLLRCFKDRLCRRRGKSDKALMVGGRGVRLQEESLVRKSEFFLALNGIETQGAETQINFAVGIPKELVFSAYADEIQKTKRLVFIVEKGQFYTEESKTLWGLPLEEPVLLPATENDIRENLPQACIENKDLILKNNEELSHWLQRLDFYEHHTQQQLDRESFFKEAFEQACLGEKSLSGVYSKNLLPYFENSLPSDIRSDLSQKVPDKIEMPSGSKIRVHYPLDKNPYLEVRIQEVFGMNQTPKVLDGLDVTFHLLGPNFRPVQVTSNLESFWKNGYPEVRKELRIKYPKHQWPENPYEGTPEAKGRRRH